MLKSLPYQLGGIPMQCPVCEHEAAEGAFGDPAKCPSCGVFYHKALANKERIEQARAAKARPAPQPVKAAPVKRLGFMYCPSCGATNSGRTQTKGSIFVELILWLCFLLPGLIYSIWRLASRQQVCQTCSNPGLIPTNSPRAKKELGLE
ncbi:MAG: hypothetical protein KJ989_15255 [Gammaproteobacteria bacterium]|nr:hypothetical protein [Gammaproteobacteria bacterium]MBU2255912.1 hypothetical protein [Gammaproteobacteria bacterium]MBU2295557.1 hypothetical protein [Gammaproteobacteria bacterium]